MNKTENVRNIDELNSKISMYVAGGYNVAHKDDKNATLTKNSINWLVLILLLLFLWPGAILYIILYTTGDVGKKKSIFIKVINHDKQPSNTKDSSKINIKHISTPEDENNINVESINLDFSTNMSSLKTYEKRINELKKLYLIKEKIAQELIEKRFSPPQITYDRFMDAVDKCSVLFYDHADSALNIIRVATGHTPKVDEELKKKLDILKSIVGKIDELTNELAINLNNSEQSYSEEVKDLLEDMQKLVDSVKEYD